METIEDFDFVYRALLNEYYSIGATGESASQTMLDDLANMRLDESANDWGVSVDLITKISGLISRDIQGSLTSFLACNGLNTKRLHESVYKERRRREDENTLNEV